MKRVIALTVAALMVLAIAGCKKKEAAAPEPAPAPAPEAPVAEKKVQTESVNLADAVGYINANDVELGSITSSVAKEDGFFLNGIPEKALEVTQGGEAITVGNDVYTQRFKYAAKVKDGDFRAPTISFSAKKGQVVILTALSSSKTDARVALLFNEAGDVVAELPVNAYADQYVDLQRATIPEDGTYYIGSKSGTIYVYQVTLSKK